MQARPALVISEALGPDGSLFWSMMITSARRSPWPGDISLVDDHRSCGLPVPCFIRTAKIAALEVASIDRRIGRLTPQHFTVVRQQLQSYLRLA